MPGTRSSAGPQRWLRGHRREPSDAALAVRAGHGDRAAFEQIFRRHHPRLLAYCRHTLADAQDAEDALQQTFISAHQALRTSGPPRELRPWLYAIARNCCRDVRARRPTDVHLTGDLPLVGLSDPVREREELRELLRDVAALPEQQRTALLLAELEGMAHRSIAAIIGCPEARVRALVYQARSALLAERSARETPCETVRRELAVARAGQLRRGPLRRHLRRCPGCRQFAEAVREQRSALALALPVAPAAELLPSVLAGSGVGSSSMLSFAGSAKGVAALVVAAATAVGMSSLPGPSSTPRPAAGASGPASVSIMPASLTATNSVAPGAAAFAASRRPSATSLAPGSAVGSRAHAIAPAIRLRRRVHAAVVRRRIAVRIVRRVRRRAVASVVLARARTRPSRAAAPLAVRVGARRATRRRILRALRR